MRLKALKVEIEHLQLLDKAKVKLQKEFEVWWAEEATNLQVCCGEHQDMQVEGHQSASGLWGHQGVQVGAIMYKAGATGRQEE